MQKYIEKAAVLIEALPYIQRLRGAIVVVKFGGSAMEDPETVAGALRDIVFMECVGMQPVLVHGGGKAISARLKQLGIPSRFIRGLRYTCDRTIGVVDDVLHHQVNPELVAQITRFGGRAQGLSGKLVIRAERTTSRDPATGKDEDLGWVGEVTGVDVQPIRAILAADQVPVLTPLGSGADGRPFNINADTSACRIAEALGAHKLVFLSDVPGILRDPADPASLIPTIRMDEVPGLVANGTLSGGMLPKVESAVAALRAGVNKVHLIDGRLQHSLLLEIFTDRGVGTELIH